MKKKVGKKAIIGVGAALSLAAVSCVTMGMFAKGKQSHASSDTSINGVMMQGFEWYLKNTGTHWNDLADKASDLSKSGITALWLPPAYKGGSSNDVGYGVYDIYDLGEFNQKGTVRTKYGTKDEYLNLIDTLHDNDIQVYADVVLNHMGNADECQTVSAYKCNSGSRDNTISGAHDIGAWCVFNFPGRNGKYSTFKWDASCFDGVDWDEKSKSNGVYRFANKNWDWQVDTENGNYDYLMYADVDFDNNNVVNELKKWGEWYVDTADLDGFRLDAVKHIKYTFYKDWLNSVRSATGKELFSVGEFWSGDINKLNTYIDKTEGTTSLFDVPLHYNFQAAGNSSGGYNMAKLFDSTLVKGNPTHAVTFVDNHDSQPGQSLESTVQQWFKPLAYTAILTREGGYPCVFYGDYYGTADGKISSNKNVIDKILKARKEYAYGKQHDYLDDANVIGWTREGDKAHKNSGLAALITDGAGGSKSMYVGTNHSGETWYDITGNVSNKVTINGSGYGTFTVNGGSHSIWVPVTSASDNNDDNNSGDNNEANAVTVYYYNTNNWNDVYIHYQVDGTSWTAVPGKQMTSVGDNYYSYTIDLKSATKATVCFNNGNNSWDSNNSSNYVVKTGDYIVKDGSSYAGKPDVKDDNNNGDNNSGDNNEANAVTVYYYNTNNWNDVYIHYQVDGTSWTAVPGYKMTSNGNNYYSYTIDLGTATKATVCFNNGNNSWDSKNGSNYAVYEGNYIVKDGNACAGTP